MVLVLILLGIIIFILLLFLILLFSSIQVSVENFKIANDVKLKDNNNFKIRISLFLFKKIKTFMITFDYIKMKNIYVKQKDKLDINKVKDKIPMNKGTIKIIKESDIELSEFHLNLELCLEDVILTSGAIAMISTLFPFFISLFVDRYDNNKFQYSILPKYVNTFLYKISLDCKVNISIKEIVLFALFMINSNKQDKEENRIKKQKKAFHQIKYNYN